MTPPNARSAVELLTKLIVQWNCKPSPIANEAQRALWTQAWLDLVLQARAFLAAEPQQDNDAGAAPRKDAVSPPASTSPASPIQPGEVAALIERLREIQPGFDGCVTGHALAQRAAAMLARLSAERDAAHERCAKVCDDEAADSAREQTRLRQL